MGAIEQASRFLTEPETLLYRAHLWYQVGGGFMQLPAETDTAGQAMAVVPSRKKPRKLSSINWSYAITSWLGFVPFLLFCLLFELLPAVMIIQGSFTDSNTGALTLNNYQRVITEVDKLHAFQNSITLSIVTALIGAVLGFLAAYGLFNLRISWLQNL